MVDTLDLKIIDLLKQNARFSFAAIGRQISLSASSVRERIQKLEDVGIIESYAVQVNNALMGNGLEVFIMLKIFSGKLIEVIAEINSFSEVQEAYRITGSHNIHLRVVLRDQLHLQEFIDKLISYGDPTTHLILSDLKKA